MRCAVPGSLFSRNGGVGWVVGLDDLTGLFQPMILNFLQLLLAHLLMPYSTLGLTPLKALFPLVVESY